MSTYDYRRRSALGFENVPIVIEVPLVCPPKMNGNPTCRRGRSGAKTRQKGTPIEINEPNVGITESLMNISLRTGSQQQRGGPLKIEYQTSKAR